MAEAVFRKKIKDAGLEDKIQVDSAGTGGWHVGQPPHKGTCRILKQNGIDYSGITARQAGKEDFYHFNYLIAMDSGNIDNLLALAPSGHQAELKKLMDFVPERKETDVPDPYYTGNFEEVFNMVNEGCDRLLAYICEKEGFR
jgi:protein-tyrosine phosphatase